MGSMLPYIAYMDPMGMIMMIMMIHDIMMIPYHVFKVYLAMIHICMMIMIRTSACSHYFLGLSMVES